MFLRHTTLEFLVFPLRNRTGKRYIVNIPFQNILWLLVASILDFSFEGTSFKGIWSTGGASQVVLVVKNPSVKAGNMRDVGSISWVRKIPCSRAWKSTPVFLPGESQGQRSLVGYSPWGRKESDTTEWIILCFIVYSKLTTAAIVSHSQTFCELQLSCVVSCTLPQSYCSSHCWEVEHVLLPLGSGLTLYLLWA